MRNKQFYRRIHYVKTEYCGLVGLSQRCVGSSCKDCEVYMKSKKAKK